MSLTLIVIISCAFLAILAVVIYVLPTDKQLKKKKEKELPQPEKKDWEGIAKRWEKNNEDLHKELNALDEEKKKVIQELEGQKIQYKELVEKLAQEKSWREKEHSSTEKVKQRDEQLKTQLQEAETKLDQEHSNRLKIERELQDAKINLSSLTEERRNLSAKNLSLEASLLRSEKELRDLKRDYAELSKQREDVQWVAKSEYEELKKVLAEKINDVDRLQRTINDMNRPPDATQGPSP